jgi:formylglycine-generating enzyme required for sulfatase activity
LSRLIEIHDRRGIAEFTDNDLPLTIGGNEDSHILLPGSLEIEGYIGESQGYLFLQHAENASALYHNDKKIAASTWIKSGDSTRIGSALIYYTLSGDLVGIHVSTVAEKEKLMPPDIPHPDAVSEDRPLPRKSGVGKGLRKGFSKLRYLTISIFLLLLLVATFVLTARSLVIVVRPEPDSLSVSGFPPVIRFGDHFLGLGGDYTVRAAKEGYVKLAAPVTIAADSPNRFTYILERLPGRIDFTTSPVDKAHIIIDGRDVGKTPLSDIMLPAGEHSVRVASERYFDQEQRITVEGLNKKQHFNFVLAPAWSEVTLTSEPDGAGVIINDRKYGTTPITMELLAGSHAILFKKQYFSTYTLELTVDAGKVLFPDTVILQPAPATLALNSMPDGATVTIDSGFKGPTPIEVTVGSKDEHTVVLSLAGYEKLTKKMMLDPGETRTLTVKLKPEYGTVFLTIEPPEAELYVDGKFQNTTTGRLKLTVREHTLEIRAKGYTSATRKITPNKQYSSQIDIKLLPVGHPSSITTQPDVKTSEGGNKMLLLGPASFRMGAPKVEPGRRSNERQFQVQISRPFYLSTREVTNGEFRRFRPKHSSGTAGRYSLNNDTQPVVNVSWDDATRYLNWLSDQDGLPPFYREKKGKMVPIEPFTIGYRLPFESEWAYASRVAGRQEVARYSWYGAFPPRKPIGNYADESARSLLPVIIKGYNDSFVVSAPVASFPKNPGGFFDLGGNVSEWCHDFYSPKADLANSVKTDPTGPATGTHHVVRDASWRDGSITEVRLSYRGYSREQRDDIGFRLARFAQ